MTKKQYACIIQAKSVIEKCRHLAVMASEECGNCDAVWYKLIDIEDLCESWQADFADTDPNYKL